MKPELRIARDPGDEPTSTLVEQGPYRAIVGEHPDRERVYLHVGNGHGGTAMFLEPAAAVTIAGALLAAAGKAIDHQFRRQMGSP